MMTLEIKGLRVSTRRKGESVPILRGIDLSLGKGETLGLVGESGSGKTMTGLSVMRLLPSGVKIDDGEIFYDGTDILGLPKQEMARIRGSGIAMISQEPDLNEIMRVGNQIKEKFLYSVGSDEEKSYWRKNHADLNDKVVSILEEVEIPRAEERVNSYPFELSGGMKQRVMIAMMALARSPDILIADEPTTALDVTVQAEILSLLNRLAKEKGMGVLLITHNLALVAEYADRVAVMREGEIVERGDVYSFFAAPRHSYSQKLLECTPRLDEYKREVFPVGQDSPVVMEVRNLEVEFPIYAGTGLFKREVSSVKAVDGVSFSVQQGEVLGIVGESGCGKTTLARSILRLIPEGEMRRSGEFMLGMDGRKIDVFSLSRAEINRLRKSVQIVFQESKALNPRRSVGDLVIEGLLIHKEMHADDRDSVAKELLEMVGVPGNAINRFPDQFSSGQRQRIVIARALALNPRVLILDEPLASLDVSVQEEVVDLLMDLKERFNLTYVLISHDIALVKDIAHRIAVMHEGRFVEIGETRSLISSPQDMYTRTLISAVPIPDPARRKGA